MEPIQERLEGLIAQQRTLGRKTEHIVMSEFVYIRFKAQMGNMIHQARISDVVSYRSIPIIRLDLPLQEEVLLVG